MGSAIWYTIIMGENLTFYLQTIIRDLVLQTRGPNAWLSIWYPIYELLEKLAPGMPDDNTSGFIAYNVSNDKRMKMKTSRFLGKKLNLNTGFVPEKDLQHYTDIINGYLFPELKIELVSGPTITEYYSEEVGGDSCMTGYNSKKVGMYARNTGVYSMLAMFSGNSSARAMVIKLDNGSFLMDRVYSDSSYLKDQMFFHAQKQGWYYRTFTGAGSLEISLSGEQITDYDDMIVSNISYCDGEVPYADTLIQYENCGNTLNLSHENSSACYDGLLDNTDGYLSGDCYSTCEDCGEPTHEGDITCVGDNWVCRECYGTNYFHCQHCETSYHDNDGQYISSVDATVCGSCLAKHFYYCNDCDEYYTEDNSTPTKDGSVCDDCCEDNYFACADCGAVYKNENRQEGLDGESYCSTCIEDHIDDDEAAIEHAIEHTEQKARADIDGQAVMEFIEPGPVAIIFDEFSLLSPTFKEYMATYSRACMGLSSEPFGVQTADD